MCGIAPLHKFWNKHTYKFDIMLYFAYKSFITYELWYEISTQIVAGSTFDKILGIK